MKTRDNKKQNWFLPRNVFKIFLVLILAIYLQLCYLTISPVIYGKNLREFASNRNTYKTTLIAKRGTLYDTEGSILATNVTSYTVIAYLSSSKKNNYVVDKESTAEALSPIINMSKEAILTLLNKDLYQVELGPGGRGITELKKEEIEDLNLPGIDFVENVRRYYPNGDFASYVVGYAKTNDQGEINGELGIESLYNKDLSGTDGSLEYQQDRLGYKIPDTPETRVEAIDGYDIYLTVDSSVQRFLESAVKVAYEEDQHAWMTLAVMDAKTGQILGAASTPSFSPNTLNITNYENPLVSFAFEPGSTMKTYTYMCAIDKGVYNGSDTYMSGSYKVGDATVYDWKPSGWGRIPFDLGIQYSSNTGIANLVTRYLSREELRSCFERFGFGAKTGVELPREAIGTLKFNYPLEVIAAGFGQGIKTTAVQHLQALSIIANNGTMIKPHIVDKIVNPNNNEIVYQSTIEKKENIVSKETASKMRDLLYSVVNNKINATSAVKYGIEGFDIIGKTGTAEIYDSKYGYAGSDYIYSFAGMYPKDDPEIIIYGAEQRVKQGGSSGLIKAVKNTMADVAKYRNMYPNLDNNEILNTYTLSNYISKNTTTTIEELEEKKLTPIIIGDGDKIINQYPNKNTTVIEGDKIFLITNDNKIKMPDMLDWSKNEVSTFFSLTNIPYKIEGTGYVTDQSIEADTIIDTSKTITIKLKDKWKEDNE